MESRLNNAKKNIFYGYIGMILITAFSFVNRTVFIYKLGATYLGISGLFTNILGLLSFSELGIGTAMTYCLYEPIAKNDNEKIKDIMYLYKFCYRIIAIIVSVIGIGLLPFIPQIVNTEQEIPYLQFYYVLFLINTVSTYFVTYKYTYIEAIQKNYITSNAYTISTNIIYLFQIVGLFIWNDYTIYLTIQIGVGLIQKIVVALYLNKKYPLLCDKEKRSVDREMIKKIADSVKAMIVDKIGTTLIYQTDNILISTFVNTTAVGLMSNYVLLRGTLSKFVNVILQSCIAGIGNVYALGNKKNIEQVFTIYHLIVFWINGFVCVAFITLVQPFMTLWVGEKMVVGYWTMVAYFIAEYVYGQSLSIINFRVATGLFIEDKWLSCIQAAVNLMASIIALKFLGLPGIYIGTIISRTVGLVIRSKMMFDLKLENNVLKYYISEIKMFVEVVIPIGILHFISNWIMIEVTIMRFIIMMIFTAIIPNIVWLIIYSRTVEFQWIYDKSLAKMLNKFRR